MENHISIGELCFDFFLIAFFPSYLSFSVTGNGGDGVGGVSGAGGNAGNANVHVGHVFSGYTTQLFCL